MGIQDREYYREELRKRSGYVEVSAFRLPAEVDGHDDGGKYLALRSSGVSGGLPDLPMVNWHWLLKLLFVLAVVASAFVVGWAYRLLQ